MASLKEVKTRINSVQSTRKITSAMKMVASAKLHKAQGAIEHMLPYQRQLNKILHNFLSGDLSIESPYVEEREVKRVAIVLFSSNSSLCGAFNANVIKMFLHTIGEYRKCGILTPEFSWQWVDREMNHFATRPQDPYIMTDDQRRFVREKIFPY